MLEMCKVYFTFAAMLMLPLHAMYPFIYTLQCFVSNEEYKVDFSETVKHVLQNVNVLYYICLPDNMYI